MGDPNKKETEMAKPTTLKVKQTMKARRNPAVVLGNGKIQEEEKTNGGFEEAVQINNDFSQRQG